MKIKEFKFPTFEEWYYKKDDYGYTNNQIEIEMGYYQAYVGSSSGAADGSYLNYQMILGNKCKILYNMYVSDNIKELRFDKVTDNDLDRLKQWYEAGVKKINETFKKHIMETYFIEEGE